MKMLHTVQPYFLWGAYALWLISPYIPYELLGLRDFPSAFIVLFILPILGCINLILALLCKRWKSALASLPMFGAFFITWFAWDLILWILYKLGVQT